MAVLPNERADLIAAEIAKRGEVHLSCIFIDGVLFPIVVETGQMIDGVRSASFNCHYRGCSTISLEVLALAHQET